MAPSYFEQFSKERFDRVKHPRVKATLEKMTAIEQRLADRTAEIRGDKDRSAEWKSKELRALAADTVKSLTKDGAHSMRRLQRDVDASRPMVPRLGSTDVVGAMEDMEIRQFVRAMPAGERINFVSNLDADSRIVAAVVRSSPEMLGVPPQVHQAVVDRVMLATHGAQYQFISETHDDIEIAETALALAMKAAADVAGMEARDWRDLVDKTIAPLNAQLAKELAKPAPRAIDVNSLVEAARTAPMQDRNSLISRLSEDFSKDQQAEWDRQMDALRGKPAA
jgi:hypothetical protein